MLLFCAGLGLIAIVMGCFVAQICQQQSLRYTPGPNCYVSASNMAHYNTLTINQYTLMAFPPSLTVQTPPVNQDVLANSTRSQIFAYINQKPGVQFRAITSALCLPVGLAEYHLGVLVRSGLVSFIRDGRYKRFFVSKRFSNRDMMLICLLRRRTPKKIFETLLSKRRLSHGRLAKEVAITSQALTWQMKTLKNSQFILYVNEDLRIIYSIDESAVQLLKKYMAVVEQHPF